MTHGFQHHHKRNRKDKKNSADRKNAIKLMDTVVYIGAALVPLTLLPQLLKIWVWKTAAGVSLISWIAFLGGASFWLTYGILHRAKPIIYMYAIMIILEILIVIGIVMYS
jgi:uncharacterized protein with PQ loop repeat